MVRILRATPAGTGQGGTGKINSAPGAQANPKSGSANDPAQNAARAAFRGPAAKKKAARSHAAGTKPTQGGKYA